MKKLYRQWVANHQDHAWSLARYLLRDAHEAEDVTQEAFIRLWQHRDSVNPDRVRPWLMKVTRNLCLDRLRLRRPCDELKEEHLEQQQGPLHHLQQMRSSESLQAAIAALGEPQRSLVVLRDLQHHSYEDIATATDLSLPQVKVYLHRARRKLRALLQESPL